MSTNVLCAACRHFPGHGELCPVAKRHATAHPKRCDLYEPGPDVRHILTLRRLAADMYRRHGNAAYIHALKVAHEAAKEQTR